MENQEPTLTIAEVAKYFRVDPRTVDQWRHRGRGPKYLRFSKHHIRYRREDLEAWTRASEVDPSATANESK